MKISLRIAGRVTSVQVRDSIASLYCTVRGHDGISTRQCWHLIQDAVHKAAGSWNGNGKGLGGFVTDSLIADILEGDMSLEYQRLCKELAEDSSC